MDIEGGKWALNPELGVNMREIRMVVKVTDVPFKDRTRIHKILTYKKEKYFVFKKLIFSNEIVVSFVSKTLDVPYGSHFQVEEKWTASPIPESPEKCKFMYL